MKREAYVPDKRARAKAIWREVLRRMEGFLP